MLMSVDPGLTTGVAYKLDNGNYVTRTVHPDGTDSMASIVADIIARKPATVIIEAFLGIQMQSKYGILTMELIGAVRAVCLLNNIEVIKRAPAQRMLMNIESKAILDERRRVTGPSFSYTVHEVSALAHLLSWERSVERRLAASVRH